MSENRPNMTTIQSIVVIVRITDCVVNRQQHGSPTDGSDGHRPDNEYAALSQHGSNVRNLGPDGIRSM